jgi:tetratricopeptide (TPR) repeat protein
MKPMFKSLTLLTCVSILLGCAAAGVPSSSDPKTKLAWATVLLEEQDRPLPAERLIQEAIEIYKAKNDEIGLAEGYRKYGIFFRSASVKRYEDVYRRDGFLDKTVTFDQRFDKAIEYFGKSRDIYAKAQTSDDLVSNVDLNMALAYRAKGDSKHACKALDSSLAYNLKFKAANPDTNIKGAGNNQSFEDVIAEQKKYAKCP